MHDHDRKIEIEEANNEMLAEINETLKRIKNRIDVFFIIAIIFVVLKILDWLFPTIATIGIAGLFK